MPRTAQKPVESDPYAEHRTVTVGDNLLAQISATAKKQFDLEVEISKLEEQLKVKKQQLSIISEKELPELMDAAETESLTTKNKLVVKVSTVLRGSIPKANKVAAAKWLDENKFGHILKRQFKIEFDKDEEAWAAKFQADLNKRKKKLRVDLDRTVHPQTLLAFLREKLEAGVEIPLKTFGVYRQRETTVKVKE